MEAPELEEAMADAKDGRLVGNALKNNVQVSVSATPA